MLGDFGSLGPTDCILLERASFLLARSERLRDADVSMRMSGEARRIIASLRKRIPASPPPAEPFGQVAAIAQAAEAVRRAAELAGDEEHEGGETLTTCLPAAAVTPSSGGRDA